MSEIRSCVIFPVQLLIRCCQWFFRRCVALGSRVVNSSRSVNLNKLKNEYEKLEFAQLCNHITFGNGRCSTIIPDHADISYSIPRKSLETWHDTEASFAGYTLLHFVANTNETFSENTKKLLELGANLFKQGDIDDRTPLHVAINSIYHSGYHVYDLVGKLFSVSVAKILLSAQVESENPLNTKCKNGLSHFHVACMVNHVEAIEFFLKNNVPVDHATNGNAEKLAGYTGLHFAVRYSSVDAAEILLNRGASIHVKNSVGMSPIHLLLERLIKVNDLINIGECKRTGEHDNEKEMLEEIVNSFLKSRTLVKSVNIGSNICDKNVVDDIGLSTLHVACTLTRAKVAEEFLKGDVDINASIESNSNLWPGWTPLHFAACCSSEIFKLLVQKGANFNIKNGKGEISLDLFLQKFSPKVVYFALSKSKTFSDTILSDDCTALPDLLLAARDINKFDEFLQGLEDANVTVSAESVFWPGYSILHLTVLMNDKYKTRKENEEKSDDRTEEEQEIYWKRLELCLERGCSVSIKNIDGLTPVHFAFKAGKAKVVEKFLTFCEENVVAPDGFSYFHVACATGLVDHVKRFLDRGLDINSPAGQSFEWYKNSKTEMTSIRANSTALHIAVILEHKDVVSYLLENGANVYCTDSLGWTPIHLSIASNKDMARLLFERTLNLQDKVTEDNLSYLHVAAYANAEAAAEKLVMDGANVDVLVKRVDEGILASFSDKTPLYIAHQEDSDGAARVLLKLGANVHLHSTAVESVFFNMSKPIAAPFVDHFKSEKSRDANTPIDSSGRTLLHLACGRFDFEWANELVNRGANVNACINEGKCKGDTPLHTLVNEAGRVKNTPRKVLELVELMMKNGADATIFSQGKTAIHRVAWLLRDFKNIGRDESAFVLPAIDSLVRNQKTFDDNPTDFEGFSHFHYACARSDVEVVGKFLKHGVNVNQMVDPLSPHNAGFTPLHFAVAHRRKEVARLLMKHGADVTAEDVRGNTPLHVAVKARLLDEDLIDELISYGASVNDTNLKDKTPLICLLKSKDFTLASLELLLSRGCLINIDEYRDWDDKGILGTAMKNALFSDRRAIMRKLLATNEVKDAIKSGYVNAFLNVVNVHHQGRITVDDYWDVIDRLMEINSEFDKTRPGFLEIYEALCRKNREAMLALFQLGADVNAIGESDRKFGLFLSSFRRKNEDSDDENDDESGEDENDETDDRLDTGVQLVMHTWKMDFIGLDKSEEAEHFTYDFTEEQLQEYGLRARCESELKKIETMEVCQDLALKSFLSEDGVEAYLWLSRQQRVAVDEFFRCKADLCRELPELCGFLLAHYRKAVARMKMWRPDKDNEIFQIHD